MRRGTWGLLGVLAGVLLLTGTVLVPSDAAAASPGIDWRPCPDAAGVDCATIEVPLDWSDPDGESIHLGLARRKATDPEHRIGSVLMDPGGPGGSGVGTVKSGNVLPERAAARFDLVGFDPRGINTSTRLNCDGDLSQQALDARRPASQADFDRLADLNQRVYDSCRNYSGALVDHADTLHVAKDMDAIRARLGEEKLNYVGYSYGSLMGQQYAELFPHRIRAMVTDGNMDHSLDSAWNFMRTETEPVEHNFRQFADWCDASAQCALHGMGTRAAYADLRKRAKAGTLTDPKTGAPVDFYALSQIAFSVNSPQAWTQLADSLKALHDGRGAITADRTAAAQVANNPYPAIWCGDWDYPIADFDEYAQLRGRLARQFPNIQWSPYVDHALTCAGSPQKTTNPQRPLDIEGAPPLVMVGNVHDPATVYRWNRTAARQSGAHLITYQGWGHTAYRRDGPSQCIRDAVNAYLIHLTVPERGLSCPATEKPSAASATADLSPLGAGPFGPAE